MLLLACQLRPPEAVGPDRIVRLASEAGFTGIALDSSANLALLPALAADALRSGLRIGFSVAPLAEAALPRGKRLPNLSAVDPDERRGAVSLATRAIEATATLGVPVVALEFGPAGLEARETDLRLQFARAEMAAGEPGGETLRAALEERRARGPALLDRCRAALDPLLAAADAGGIALALPVAATPWQVPSPREAQLLLEEFAGAPLGVVLKPAHWGVLEALRLARAAERWTDLTREGRVLWASDRVGLEADLLLGLGELDPGPGAWPAGLPTIVGGGPDVTFREVKGALRRLEEISATAMGPAPA